MSTHIRSILSGLFVLFLLVSSAAAEPVRIVVITDTQFGSESNLRNVVQGVGSKVGQNFNLLFITGDLADGGGSGEYATLKSDLAPLNLDYALASNPPVRWFNYSTGNHDTPSSIDSAFPGQRNRSAYPGISGSSNGQFGTLRIGNVVVLWANRPDGASGQDAFFAATSAAAAKDLTPWKVGHWHNPAASCSSGHGSDGTTAGWIDSYLLPAGFDLAVSGHNHYFTASCPFTDASAKTCEAGQNLPTLVNPLGLVSLTAGAAGASTRSCSGCSSWIKHCVAKHGFVVMDFTDTLATVAYYSVDGGGTPSNPAKEYEFTITESTGPTTTTLPTTTTTIFPTTTSVPGSTTTSTTHTPTTIISTTTTSVLPGTTTTTLPTIGLANGDFEEGQAGWVGWDSPDNAGEVVLTADAAHGTQAVQMFDSAVRTRSISQSFILPPNANGISVQVKTKNLGTNQARLTVEGMGQEIVVPPGTAAYRRFSLSGFPDVALPLKVVLSLGPANDGQPFNDAEVTFDDIQLTAPVGIDWLNDMVFTPESGRHLKIGFRSDTVVVWQEIAGSTTTNTTTTTLTPDTSTIIITTTSDTSTTDLPVTSTTDSLSSSTTTLQQVSCLQGPADMVLGQGEPVSNSYNLSAGVSVDASAALFEDRDGQEPLVISGGPGICWSGGAVVGNYARNASWSYMHESTRNHGGVKFVAPAMTVESARVDNVEDGVRVMPGSDGFVLRNSHFTWMRDDCFDDHENVGGGLIEDNLFDGCYVGFSARPNHGQNSGGKTVTMRGNLLRLEPTPYPHSSEALKPGHGSFFKWEDGSSPPKLRLYDNIFYAEQPTSSEGTDGLGLPTRICDDVLECSGNIMVWVPNERAGGPGTPFPDPLCQDPKTGVPCFTVIADQAGQAYWDTKVAEWVAGH